MFAWVKTSVSNRVLRWWLRAHSIFVSSCRISTKQNGSLRTYRASIVQSCDNLFDAERIAENVVQKWLEQNRTRFESQPELKWRKGHQLTCTALEFENKTVIRLLEELRSQECRERSAIEEVVLEPDD